MKFKSDVEVQAGIKDSVGSSGNAGSILSSTSTGVTWIDNYADWTSVVKHIVKNNGIAVIPKGAPVYVTGSDGTNMLVGLAGNGSEATSSKTMGLVQTQLGTTGPTQTGYVITEGLLQGLNTAGRTAGEPIWLGPNGTLIYGLTNKPYAPAHLVFIGIVTKVSAGNGEVFVKVQNGFELNEIHDVDIKTTVPINGDVLGFDGTLWVNKTIAGWLGYVPANASGTQNYVSKFTGTTVLADSQLYDDGVNIGINSSSFPNSFEKVFKINGKDSFEIINNGSYVDFFIDAQNLTGNDSNIYDTKNVYSNNIKYQWYSEYSSSGLYNIFYHPAGYLNQNGSSTYFMYTDTGYDNALKQKTVFQLNGNDKLVLLENGEVVIGDDSWYSVSNTYKSTIRSTDANQFTTNLAGKDLYIQGGRGRGTGAGGRVIISTAPSGTSGSQLNNVINSVIVDSSGNVDVYGNTTSNSFIKVGGNSTQYLKADGSVSTAMNSRIEVNFVATAGQTTFTTPYEVGQIDVYYNGSKLYPNEFTATNGTTVVLAQAATLNAQISIVKYVAALSTSAIRNETTFTTTSGQTTFSVNYTVGQVDVFYNGSKLNISEFTATDGTSVVLGFSCAAGESVVFVSYVNQVSGASGTTNYVSKFTGAASLGDSQIFDNGSNVVIGGSSGIAKLTVVGTMFGGSMFFNNGNISTAGSTFISLSTNSSERLRINTNGNVLIGTTTDAGFRLDVNGTGRFATSLTVGAGGLAGRLSVRGTTNDSSAFAFEAANSSGNSLLLVRNDGNVGIGVSPPTSRLDIGNGILTSPTLRGRTYNLSNVASQNPNLVNGTGFNSIPVRVGDIIDFPFGQTRTVTGVTDTQLTLNANWSVSFAGSNVEGRGGVVIETNNIRVISVNGNGNVGVRTSDPRANLEIEGGRGININNLGELMPNLWRDGGDGGLLIRTYNRSTDVFTSVAKINPSNGAYSALSDIRLKENILDSESAIKKVLEIKVRKFDWKSTGAKEDYGFIAQELHEVLPQYVYEGSEDVNWGVAKAELVPLLVKAIQELKAEIEILKNK